MPQLLYNSTNPIFSSVDFRETVLNAANSMDLPSFLFVVPTFRYGRELERELTAKHFQRTQRPIGRLPIHTVRSYVTQFHDRLATARRDVSPEIQIALMDRAMNSVDLSYYGRGGKPTLGVVERITRVINGIRADGILPSDFQRDLEYTRENFDKAESEGYDQAKLSDLYQIYSRYLELLRNRWTDYPGKLFFLNSELFRDRAATFRRAYPRVRTVLFYGFNEFTFPEIGHIQQLGLVQDLNVMVYFDYEEANGPLYGNFEQVLNHLTAAGFQKLDLDAMQINIPEEERRPFQHHMRRNLFRTDERIPNRQFDPFIRAVGFFTREEEAQGIASMVKSFVVDERIRPERICITTLRLDRYADLLREQLASHGIPATITASYPLQSNALVTALFSALNILASGFTRRDVVRAVSSPYLSFGNDVDPIALTDAAGKLRITRGRRRWMLRIGRRLEYLEIRLGHTPDPEDRRMIESEIKTLTRARSSFVAVERMLEEFDRKMTPAEFRGTFLQLIAKLNVTEHLLRLRQLLDSHSRASQDWQRIHDEIERDTRALAKFLTLLDELVEFLELEESGASPTPQPSDAAVADPTNPETNAPEPAAPTSGAPKHDLDFYLDQLRTAAAMAFYQIREKHDYGVLVAPIEQMQSLPFDVVILCGLVDGEFPSTYLPEAFLGKPLPGAEDRHLRRERVAFYQAITSFRDRLVLTWPRFAGNQSLVRSPFLEALLRITTLEESGRVLLLEELRVLRSRARRGESLPEGLEFLGEIQTWEELAEEAGAVIWNNQQVPRITGDAEQMLENLQHTATIERERARAVAEADPSIVPEYRGVIGAELTPEEQAAIAERRNAEYSTSQLELYARCPFKYFAARVVRATTAPNYDATLTPLERGQLLHSVLFKLYTELKEQGMLPITPQRQAFAIERAREIAAEEIKGIVFEHPYWSLDQERLLGGEMFDGLLKEWVAVDTIASPEEPRLMPSFFEVAFGQNNDRSGGFDHQLSVDHGIEVQGVHVRGRIDRVEIQQTDDEIIFAVADYKTGTPPTPKQVNEGTSLQLMIYLEVVRQMLAEKFGLPIEKVHPAGALYYRLKTRDMEIEPKYLFVPQELYQLVTGSVGKKRETGIKTMEQLQQTIDNVFAKAREYVEGIAAGEYHVTTRKVSEVCRHCDYNTTCRVGELRIAGED
ncbi:MAG: exodeoxyribonuclease V subunit gamma [Candidatus Kapabacteria bacterium]|nr:exodeoxyribonuclease V subunit gamma [Candidatus Kapabacteria bacterium]